MSSVFVLSQLQNDIKNAIQLRLWNDILPGPSFYAFALPLLCLLLGGIVVILCGVLRRKDPETSDTLTLALSVFFAFAAAFSSFIGPYPITKAFLGSGFLADGLSSLSFTVISAGTLFTFAAASFTEKGKNLLRYEMASLLLFCSAGMMIMCAAGDFLSFFTGLELTSLPLYVLIGYQRKSSQGLEATVKYFVMGATASAIIAMGMALIYTGTGSLRFSDFQLLNSSPLKVFSALGVLFFLCGLAFKLALAPFHSWAPDVYQGAHAQLTGYMASLVKFSLVIVFMRILSVGFGSGLSKELISLFWVLGVLSIVVGSLFGLVHNSIKRMLAYSSIANAGYFCLGFAALALNPHNLEAKQALVSYAVIYAVLSLGAFTVVAWLEDGGTEDILKQEITGIGKRRPFAAFALSVFLFGLAGLPPIAGFFGKFFLLLAALHAGFVALAIILVVMSCLSLYYYLSVVVSLWFEPYTTEPCDVNLPSHKKGFLLSSPNDAGMATLLLIAVLTSIVIGFIGPRFAIDMNQDQAVEQNLRIQKTSIPADISEAASETPTFVSIKPQGDIGK